MTASYNLRLQLEFKLIEFFAFLIKAPIEWFPRWLIKRLNSLLVKALLSLMEFQRAVEINFTSIEAYNELMPFERQANKLSRLTAKLNQLDANLLNQETQKALLMLKAVSLLNESASKIILEPSEVQDEVMRIAALRTEPSYWEDTERKQWLEAELS
jgi:hypothetical protein